MAKRWKLPKKSDKSHRKCIVTRAVTHMLTHSSQCNTFHYGPTNHENLSYPKVASYMTQFQSDFTRLPTCFFQINEISKE